MIDVDYVHTDGHDLGVRWALNTRINGGARRYADLPLNPTNPTLNMSIGSSRYNGVNFGIRRRMDQPRAAQRLVFAGEGDRAGRAGGRRADDEPRAGLDPAVADVQSGPAARTDARHKVTLSAIIQAPWGVTVSPIYRFRSAMPIHIWYGYDNNADGVSNDIYPTA